MMRQRGSRRSTYFATLYITTTTSLSANITGIVAEDSQFTLSAYLDPGPPSSFFWLRMENMISPGTLQLPLLLITMMRPGEDYYI